MTPWLRWLLGPVMGVCALAWVLGLLLGHHGRVHWFLLAAVSLLCLRAATALREASDEGDEALGRRIREDELRREGDAEPERRFPSRVRSERRASQRGAYVWPMGRRE